MMTNSSSCKFLLLRRLDLVNDHPRHLWVDVRVVQREPLDVAEDPAQPRILGLQFAVRLRVRHDDVDDQRNDRKAKYDDDWSHDVLRMSLPPSASILTTDVLTAMTSRPLPRGRTAS